MTLETPDGTEIAIIGMSCRLPGAPDVDAFWHNLQGGVESIRHFSDDELKATGMDSSALADPRYVKSASFLDDSDLFDAAFFDISHREAEITDPQHRVLLECAWSALEHAGYNPFAYPGAISVYAGATINTYLLLNLAANPQAIANLEQVQLNIGNAGDFLTTRIAYKLNLKGACYTVQSACSTSLVAVHLACENLLSEACDMALAGGVSVNVGFQRGYRYLEGGMSSPDGRCRPFDAQAQGTIFGSGAGLVVLKRLRDALRDGDTIHAVIKGSAVNNDGSFKVGYTTPSVDGQAQVITEALATAGVDAATITYVEAHGTATPLGDPIEIQALTKAFRTFTTATGFCAIGSVKGNIGHLDAAAGVAGLLKTVLALKNGQIPPSLHFERPNPTIDFAATPFYVNTDLTEWHPQRNMPRRAGVSAFGVGGTNAHVVLEEPPPAQTADPSRVWQLVMLSGKTETAVSQQLHNLAAHLTAHPQTDLADVAYTLQVGRPSFAHRRFVLAQNNKDAAHALNNPERLSAGVVNPPQKRSLTFMFPGQGAQYPNMGRGLYEEEPVFRQEVEHCALVLRRELGFDLRQVLYPQPGQEAEAAEQLQQTAVSQPALFVTSYALARLWLSWGIQPNALVGHSLGEYVAACLAGVFSLEDGLKLVAARGRLMQSLPTGAMLAVPLSEFEVQPYLDGEVSLAAVNGPGRCVLAGPHSAIDQLAQQFQNDGLTVRRLHTSHAFHSAMMNPILDSFQQIVKGISLHPPQIPYLSNVSGGWITAEEATSPVYWANHLRHTVRFADNLTTLLTNEQQILLELGPGETLSQLTRQHLRYTSGQVVVPALRQPPYALNDVAASLNALGKLWLAGVEPNWAMFYGAERRLRVPLPTYPFERQRYWIEPSPKTAVSPLNGLPHQTTQEPAQLEPASHQTLYPRPNLPTIYVPPGSEHEQLIGAIWQETLGIEKVGVLDNFFELGGDSLLAIQAIAQLKKRMQMEIPVASLYEGVTIRELAQVVRELEQETAVSTPTDTPRETRISQRKQLQEQQRAKRRQVKTYDDEPTINL